MDTNREHTGMLDFASFASSRFSSNLKNSCPSCMVNQITIRQANIRYQEEKLSARNFRVTRAESTHLLVAVVKVQGLSKGSGVCTVSGSFLQLRKQTPVAPIELIQPPLHQSMGTMCFIDWQGS